MQQHNIVRSFTPLLSVEWHMPCRAYSWSLQQSLPIGIQDLLRRLDIVRAWAEGMGPSDCMKEENFILKKAKKIWQEKNVNYFCNPERDRSTLEEIHQRMKAGIGSVKLLISQEK